MAGRGDTVTRIEVIEGGKGGRGGVERRAEREIVKERGESFVFRNYEDGGGTSGDGEWPGHVFN